MDCLFCKIGSKEISAEVIYEDNDALAFLDIHPCSPGHTLIIPKEHFGNIIEVSDEKMGNIFIAVKRVTIMLERALKPAGFTIGINHGSISGQSVDHLHIHAIPRYEGDGGGSIHSVVKNPGTENPSFIKEKILKAS